MVSMSEEFAASRHKPKYEFMARVEGKYKNIPFVGSIGNDTVISEAEGPIFTIHLDLPIKVDGAYISFLKCKQSEIKNLKRRAK
jgi:hypothetical protein